MVWQKDKRNRSLWLVAGCLLGLAWSAFNADFHHAFVRIGSRARWQTLPVPYRIHAGGLPGLGNSSEFIAVQRAFDTWQNLPTSSVAFHYEGASEVQNGGNDGVNIISFQDTSFSFGTGTIAVTLSSSSQGIFRDADILFNPANPNIPFATDGRSDAFDIQAIATHEIGHFLGLDHTSIVSATMNPTGARGTVFPRALKSDDIIGASTIYPETGFLNSTGGLRGRVTNAGANVFGAHVVILDGEGNAVVSTLTELDGTYQLSGLAPGSHSLYAEPLDGPVTEASIGGQYDSRVNVNFTTTFLGNTLNPAQRQIVQITAGSTLQEINLPVFPAPASALNLTSPSLGQRVGQGATVAFNARGDGVFDGVTFQILGPALSLATPVFSGGNTARLTATVDAAASIGVRTLFAQRGDATSALSGGLIITGQPPTLSSIEPGAGMNSGGTRVTVAGANFNPGTEVFLAGVPLTEVSVLDSATLVGTTGPNKTGPLTLLAVNPDGTSGTLASAFVASALPPAVSALNPSSGPPTTVVTLTGSNFDSSAANVSVAFNGVAATVVSAAQTQITAIVPFGATTGPVTVTIFGQQVSGPVFTVTAPKPSTNRAETQFQYVDTSSGSGGARVEFLASNDDDTAQLTLPFDFTLFTSTFLAGSRLNVTTNGWMAFGASSVQPEFQNGSLPGTAVPRQGAASGTTGTLSSNLIAPFFDDLILQRQDSNVSTRLIGTAPDRRWVIDWQNLSILHEDNFLLDGRVSFQVVLFEGSNDIAFQYKTLEGPRSHGESATVGLQNAARNLAAQFSFNQARLYPGRVIVFRFNPNDATYQVGASEVKQYIPLVADTARFRTNLGLTNVSTAQAQATLSLYAANGSAIASRIVSVPAGGLVQLNNVISFIRGLSSAQVNNLSGSVVVSASQPVMAFATQIDNTSDDPSLQTGRSAGSTQLLIPSATSVNQFRSSLVVQNAGGTAAQVRLRQRDTNGLIRGEMVVSIEPNGFFSRDDVHATLGLSNLFGPLDITSLNSVLLVATSRVYSVNSGTSGFFEGQDASAASSNGVIPISQDSSTFRTNIGINNLGAVAADVQVSLYSSSGALLGTTSVNVPAGGLRQLDNVNRTLTGAGGVSNTLGYIRISSSQPVLGYSALINNTGDDPGLAASLVSGATRLLIPSSTNVNQFRSTLTIINLASIPAPIRIIVRNTLGDAQAQSDGTVIPANGIFNVDDILTSLGLSSSYGPIEIQSLNEIPLAAISRVYSIIDNTSGFFAAQPY
ncbi:MAG: IPT/TIG domain-containing protein [Acidobacteria bacterium]|nr:IPT/TIG domain-containing protein [Acidobacteriota bacterium]